jgi:putative transposase
MCYALNMKLTAKVKLQPNGAIAYDDRVLNWRLKTQTVSIWTLHGRQSIPFVTGARQLKSLETRQGETDLAYIRGEFYLFFVYNVDELEPVNIEGVLGVDLGVTNIAVTSDGDVMPGRTVNNVRHRHRRLRKKLQSKGTKSTHRRLKRLSGKERRFARDVNHQISKRIVATAQGTGRMIALEDLKGIRARITVRRSQRATLHSWSFHQLRTFIEYKAQLAGIPVVTVDPKNTSRTCPCCGYIDKANRPSQFTFSCVRCGFSGLADHIAAENIRRAAISLPYVSDMAVTFSAVAPGTSPRPLGLGS